VNFRTTNQGSTFLLGCCSAFGRQWPEADAPIADVRGNYRGQSGHPVLTARRQLLTDTVEKGKNEPIEIFACVSVETCFS
jgi:hypothetical protein